MFKTKSIRKLLFLIIAINFKIISQDKNNKSTTISFEYYTHDFGTIKEDGGIVSYEFEFRNAGNNALTIKNVQAGCGCTVPQWPKDPIAPGGTGKITVEFNPVNKPGTFNKTLTVFSNSTTEATILSVQGKVIPRPRKPADDYPDLLGSFRMVSRYLNFGDVTTEKPVKKEYTIYNQSDTAVVIQKLFYNQDFMKVSIDPMTIAPKSKSKVHIEYDPNKRNDFGYVHDRIELLTNDSKMAIKNIYVAATISKYFPQTYTAEERAKLPKIKFDKTVHDFGTIKPGEKVNTIFIIKNEGGDNLNIYKVKPSCGCTIGELDKKVLKPGEETKLHITFDTAGKEGIQEKHINIYCNDPANFNMVLTIKAKIAKGM